MKAHRVLAAVRGGFLRLGFHAFNNEDDVDAALEALGRP
jgi:selenocysteine lyase/cysteine desulfurase